MADFQGIWSTGTGGLQSIVGGTSITIDNTDPLNPIINSSALTGIEGWTPSLTFVGFGGGYNSRLAATGTDPNISAVISPKGTGSLQTHIPDFTFAGGNVRGSYSIDLQLWRSDANQVASGTASVIAGGRANRASGEYSGVLSGWANEARGGYSAVLTGSGNIANGNGSVILAGGSCLTTKANSYAMGQAACTYTISQRAFAGFGNNVQGFSQEEEYIVSFVTGQNVGAITAELTADKGAPSADNRIFIQNGSYYTFWGIIQGFNQNALGGTVYNYCAEFKGVVRRINSSTIAFLGSPLITVLGNDSGGNLSFDLQLDTTNNVLKIVGVTTSGVFQAGWNAYVKMLKN